MAKSHLKQMKDCSEPCTESCNCGVNHACVGPIEQEMQRHFSVQLDLCNQLEEIADALPQKVDRQKLLIIARSILPTVKTAHRFEEDRIFPHIKSEARERTALNISLERLQYEHWEDESFAEELCDGLIRFVTDSDEPSANTLGYMLRGFFEGLRRHIAFEVEHIIPLLRLHEQTERS
ncbi:MAG: hemerythrin domain-containing protein [Rhizobiaceae bacterium]|nr:hemerythrin domain-containing protein [Rhizobiaceae bacterium]